MQIRPLTAADATTLRQCRLRALEESPDVFLVTYAEVEATPLATFERELLDPDIWYVGAFEGDELVGFMRYVRPQRAAMRHTAVVRSVFVNHAFRGRGIARELLSTLVRAARESGIESLTIAVLATNEPARRLYEAMGFVVFGIEPRAIRKAGGYVDQVHLALDLGAARSFDPIELPTPG